MQIDTTVRALTTQLLDEAKTEVGGLFQRAIAVPRVSDREYQAFVSQVLRLKTKQGNAKLIPDSHRAKVYNLLTESDEDDVDMLGKRYQRQIQRVLEFANEHKLVELVNYANKWTNSEKLISEREFESFKTAALKLTPEANRNEVRIIMQTDAEDEKKRNEGQLWRITNAINYLKTQENMEEAIEYLREAKKEFMENAEPIHVFPDSVLAETKQLWTFKRQVIKQAVTSGSPRDTVLQRIPVLLPDSDADPATILCGVEDILTFLKSVKNEAQEKFADAIRAMVEAKQANDKTAWDNAVKRLNATQKEILKKQGVSYQREDAVARLFDVDVLSSSENFDPAAFVKKWPTMENKEERCSTVNATDLTNLSRKGYLKTVVQMWPWVPSNIKQEYLDNLSFPKNSTIIPERLLPEHRWKLRQWTQLSVEIKTGESVETFDRARAIFNTFLRETQQRVDRFDLLEFYHWFTKMAMRMWQEADTQFLMPIDKIRILSVIKHKKVFETFPKSLYELVPTKYHLYLADWNEGLVDDPTSTKAKGFMLPTRTQTMFRQKLETLELWLSAWVDDEKKVSRNEWRKAHKPLPPEVAAAKLLEIWHNALEEIFIVTNSVLVKQMILYGTVFHELPSEELAKLPDELKITLDTGNPLFASEAPLQTRIRQAYSEYKAVVDARPVKEDSLMDEKQVEQKTVTIGMMLNAFDVKKVLQLLLNDDAEELELKKEKPLQLRLDALRDDAKLLRSLLLRDSSVLHRWNSLAFETEARKLVQLPRSPRNNILIDLGYQLLDSMKTPWSVLRKGEWNNFCAFPDKVDKLKCVKFPTVDDSTDDVQILMWKNLLTEYMGSRGATKEELSTLTLHRVDYNTLFTLMEMTINPFEPPMEWTLPTFVSDLIEVNGSFAKEAAKWMPWKTEEKKDVKEEKTQVHLWKQVLKRRSLLRADGPSQKLAAALRDGKITSEEFAILMDQRRSYEMMKDPTQFTTDARRRRFARVLVDDDEDMNEEFLQWNEKFKLYYGIDWTNMPSVDQSTTAFYAKWKNNVPYVMLQMEIDAFLAYIDSKAVDFYRYSHLDLSAKGDDNPFLIEFNEAINARMDTYQKPSQLERDDLPAFLRDQFPQLPVVDLFRTLAEEGVSRPIGVNPQGFFLTMLDHRLKQAQRRCTACFEAVMATENGCVTKSRILQNWAFQVYRKMSSTMGLNFLLDFFWVPTNDSVIQEWLMRLSFAIEADKKYNRKILSEPHNLPVPPICKKVIQQSKKPEVYGVQVGLNVIIEALHDGDTAKALDQLDMMLIKDLEELASGKLYPRYKNHFLRCGAFNRLYGSLREDKELMYKVSLEEANDVFQHYNELPYEALWYAFEHCPQNSQITIPPRPVPNTGRYYLMDMCTRGFGSVELLNKRLPFENERFAIRRLKPDAAQAAGYTEFPYLLNGDSQHIIATMKTIAPMHTWISGTFYDLEGYLCVQAVNTIVRKE